MAESQPPKDLPIPLPTKAIQVILSKLPIEPLARFTIVSKSWKALICSPQFNILRYKSQPQDRFIVWGYEQYSTSLYLIGIESVEAENISFAVYEPYEIRPSRPLCSCNGVLLMKSPIGDGYHLSLYNPIINVNATILTQHESKDMSINYGHFYDSRNDDYKVVVLSRQCNGEFTYSVGSCRNRAWDEEKPFPYVSDGSGSVLVMYKAVFVDGCFYWWVVDEKSLMCFDVMEESLNVMPVPKEVKKLGKKHKIRLTEVAGRLCLYSKNETWSRIQFWVMKKNVGEDGEGEWQELFRMVDNIHIASEGPSRLTNPDLMVCLADGSEYLDRARFVAYDEAQGRYVVGHSPSKNDSRHYFLPFTKSLFSPTQCW